MVVVCGVRVVGCFDRGLVCRVRGDVFGDSRKHPPLRTQDGLLAGLNPKKLGPTTRYITKAFEYGVKIVTGKEGVTPGQAGAREGSVAHRIVAYDDLSVTAQYTHGQEPLVTFPLVRGSPFLSAQYKAGVVPKLEYLPPPDFFIPLVQHLPSLPSLPLVLPLLAC